MNTLHRLLKHSEEYHKNRSNYNHQSLAKCLLLQYFRIHKNERKKDFKIKVHKQQTHRCKSQPTEPSRENQRGCKQEWSWSPGSSVMIDGFAGAVSRSRETKGAAPFGEQPMDGMQDSHTEKTGCGTGDAGHTEETGMVCRIPEPREIRPARQWKGQEHRRADRKL